MPHPESPPISIAFRGANPADPDPEFTVVWLRGEHDIATKIALIGAITRAAQHDDADLLVDLSGVTFMDASTIGAFLQASELLNSHSIAVRAPSPVAIRVLEMCGLTRLLHSSAVGAVAKRSAAAALRSWVEVPPTPRDEQLDQRADLPAPADAEDVAARSDVTPPKVGVTIQLDRGGT